MEFQEYPKWIYSDPDDASTGVLVQDANQESELTAPDVETKEYADGTQATGVAPLPEHSPTEQLASAKRTYTRRAK